MIFNDALRAATIGAIVTASATAMPAAVQGAPTTDDKVRVVILGTSAGRTSWRGTESGGPSTAIQVGDDVYVVDFGRNWLDQYFRSGLGTPGKPNTPGGLENLRAGFITHLHGDHVVDLPTLILFGSSDGLLRRTQPTHIYGPGKADYVPLLKGNRNAANVVTPDQLTRSTQEMFDLLVAAFSTDLNDNILDSGRPNIGRYLQAHNIPLPDGIRPTVHDVAPDMEPFEVYKDENITVTGILASHGPIHPAFAFRFETPAGVVVFSGDTGPHANIDKIAKGADILIHEANNEDEVIARFPSPTEADRAKMKHLLESHTDLKMLGQVAAKAGVSQLVISHHSPITTGEMVAERVTGFGGKVVLGKPGMEFVLTR